MARGANVAPAPAGSTGFGGFSATIHRGIDAIDDLFGIDSRKPFDGAGAGVPTPPPVVDGAARGNVPTSTPSTPAIVAPVNRQIAGEAALYVVVPLVAKDGRPAWAVTNGPCTDVAMCTSEALARRVADMLNASRGQP